jgi:hypothetical protein
MVDDDNRDVHALHPGLLQADDEKIRRILAVVDDLADPAVNQALLDPLRPRLAALRPVRPLRFARLLFIPFDPLTVPVAEWRPGEPAIPRPILIPVARMVREGVGDLAATIDTIIACDQHGVTQAITEAGARLWPRAAEVLATAPVPADWPHAEIPAAAFPALAAILAAVLRRAARLRRLLRNEELGGLEPDLEAVNDILRDIASEAPLSRTMVARLLLVRSPHAMPLLRRVLAEDRSQPIRAMMRQAIEWATEATVARMEQHTAFGHTIGHGALAHVGEEARRITAVLRQIETSAEGAAYRARLTAIRAKLDASCRARFARGVGEVLLTRLTAAAQPMDAPGQADLETCARHLRKLDTSARGVGEPTTYDQQLRQAEAAVRAAAAAGTLTPMRQIRLIEILAGPEAAHAAYLQATAKV